MQYIIKTIIEQREISFNKCENTTFIHRMNKPDISETVLSKQRWDNKFSIFLTLYSENLNLLTLSSIRTVSYIN